MENLSIPEFICELTFWKFTEYAYKILCYKIWREKKKKKYVSPPYIFIKRYTWSINW